MITIKTKNELIFLSNWKGLHVTLCGDLYEPNRKAYDVFVYDKDRRATLSPFNRELSRQGADALFDFIEHCIKNGKTFIDLNEITKTSYFKQDSFFLGGYNRGTYTN